MKLVLLRLFLRNNLPLSWEGEGEGEVCTFVEIKTALVSTRKLVHDELETTY